MNLLQILNLIFNFALGIGGSFIIAIGLSALNDLEAHMRHTYQFKQAQRFYWGIIAIGLILIFFLILRLHLFSSN